MILFKFQEFREYKYAPRLVAGVFELSNSLAKMRVSTAMAVFSQDTAAALRMLVKYHNYSADLLTTALFCDMFGKWFHLMDSRHQNTSLSHKNMGEFNEKVKFLKDFMIFTDSLQTHPDPKMNYRKDFQKGLILSTTSAIDLANNLLLSGHHDYFLPSTNSSCMCENFFSTVRNHNNAPTTAEFEQIMKALVVMRSSIANTGPYLHDGENANLVTSFKQLQV